MSADSFIDTNVFIYLLEGLDERKADKAEQLIESGIAGGTACISFQVVQECLNTATKSGNTSDFARHEPLFEIRLDAIMPGAAQFEALSSRVGY